MNVDKPAGMTSFSVVRQLRRLSRVKRVGHAGTLDPLATGVLPVLIGSATRLSEYALKLRKTYIATVHLGFNTATDDAEGEKVAAGDPSGLDESQIQTALQGFVGRIDQQPPAFSAVKVDGQRSYKLARAGNLDRPAARSVEIHSIRLLGFTPGAQAQLQVEVVCGSGTYLRSLARDLGAVLGVGGYLGELKRSAYGPLKVEEAHALDALNSQDAIQAALLSASVLLPEAELVNLNVEQEAMVRQGRAVRVLPEPKAALIAARDSTGGLVAIGRLDPLRRTFVPEKVLS